MSTESEAELARSLDRRAVEAAEAGDVESAGLFFSEALAIRRKLAESAPSTRPELAMALRNMGVFWYKRGDKQEARNFFVEAAEAYRESARESSELYMAEHAKTLTMLAYLSRSEGDAEGAEKAFREAIASYRSLAKGFPLDHVLRFGNALRDFAALLEEQGRIDDAAHALVGALGIYRLNPQDAEAAACAIDVLERQGKLMARAGREEEAAEKIREFLVEVAALAPQEAAQWEARAQAARELLGGIGG